MIVDELEIRQRLNLSLHLRETCGRGICSVSVTNYFDHSDLSEFPRGQFPGGLAGFNSRTGLPY